MVNRQSKHVIADRQNKHVTFKKYVLFIDCISETNNTQIDDAKSHGILMPMYGLLIRRDNY